MRQYRFRDLIANLENRIQSGHRLLKNHGNFVAAPPSHFHGIQIENILTV